jgi:hypothetical protein
MQEATLSRLALLAVKVAYFIAYLSWGALVVWAILLGRPRRDGWMN